MNDRGDNLGAPRRPVTLVIAYVLLGPIIGSLFLFLGIFTNSIGAYGSKAAEFGAVAAMFAFFSCMAENYWLLVIVCGLNGAAVSIGSHFVRGGILPVWVVAAISVGVFVVQWVVLGRPQYSDWLGPANYFIAEVVAALTCWGATRSLQEWQPDRIS